MNILLVDDEEDCMESLAVAIEPAGHVCTMYTSPEAAVSAYKTGHYDVVISDMRMPGMNGIQVLQALRAYDSKASVIINTGYGDVETAIAAVNNGAFAFFGKPVDISELLETLDKIDSEQQQKKMTRAEQEQMSAEYQRLKKAYDDILRLLNEKSRNLPKG
jgi:DNA-binding NtrC family response regulator